jgi:hypothetical protein
MKSDLHIAALSYITKGYRIIPIAPGAKTPMLKKWHENALETEQEVDDFWTANPDCNIAFCPEDMGMAIVEQDPGGDVRPLELPATYEVQSPRGGIHYYFKGSVPPSASKLAPHIDTRGRSSYVLIPPSLVNGRAYSVHADREVAALPVAIETSLAPRVDAGVANVREIDLVANVERGRVRLRDLAQRGAVAIEGRGGDNFTYQISCELIRDLGISVDRALELMLEEWNPHCIPPWSTEELRAKLEHVSEYGQNEAGTYAVAPASEVFAVMPLDKASVQDPMKPGQPRGRFLFKTADQMANSPPPEWIIPELIPAGQVILFTGAKGNFKSFLALDVGLGVASGQSTFGCTPLKTGPVFYGAWEGLQLLEKVHRGAWMTAHGLEPTDDSVPFHMGAGLLVGSQDEVDNFGLAICDALDWYHTGQHPRLVILDTYSKSMGGLDENSPADVNRFITFCNSLIALWPGCSVLILAHTGKDLERGTRGSSSFEAGVDTVIDINRVDKTMMVKAHVRHMRAGPERIAPFILQGRKQDDSLVFEYMQPAEAAAVTGFLNPMDPLKVAHILREVGAVGEDNAIGTPALATYFVTQDGKRAEQVQADLSRAIKTLNVLARKSLARLTINKGHQLQWYVPPTKDEEPPAS